MSKFNLQEYHKKYYRKNKKFLNEQKKWSPQYLEKHPPIVPTPPRITKKYLETLLRGQGYEVSKATIEWKRKKVIQFRNNRKKTLQKQFEALKKSK